MVTSFLQSWDYYFLNSSLSSLEPYFYCLGVSILLNHLFSLFCLSFVLLLFAFLRRTAEPTPSSFHFLSSRNLYLLGDFNCHHLFWDSKGTSDSSGEEVFNWVISSDLLLLDDPDTSTLLHPYSRVDLLLTSPLLLPLLPSLAAGRCCRTWISVICQFH